MRAFVLIMLTVLSAQSIIAQHQSSDCISAMKVCDKDPVVFDNLFGAGINPSEVDNISCYTGDFPETNSAWITWTVQEAGTLEFSIIPVDENDDFDFVLYRVNDVLNLCNGKEDIRCMTSGESIGDIGMNYNCLGVTGLKFGTGDTDEWQGCGSDDDNFLEGLNTEIGENYILFINNFTSANGFVLEFLGSTVFDDKGVECQGDISSTVNNLSPEIEIGNIYPNPTTDKLTMEINMPESADAVIHVFNSVGNIKYESRQQLIAGLQSLPVDVSNYQQGYYFLKIKIGEEFYLTRFYKQ